MKILLVHIAEEQKPVIALWRRTAPQTTLVTIRCVERCNNVERASRTCLHLHYHHHHLLPAHLWGTICILCIIIRSLLVLLLLLLLTRKATEPLNSITTQWPGATVTTHLIHPHGAAFMPVRALHCVAPTDKRTTFIGLWLALYLCVVVGNNSSRQAFSSAVPLLLSRSSKPSRWTDKQPQPAAEAAAQENSHHHQQHLALRYDESFHSSSTHPPDFVL